MFEPVQKKDFDDLVANITSYLQNHADRLRAAEEAIEKLTTTPKRQPTRKKDTTETSDNV